MSLMRSGGVVGLCECAQRGGVDAVPGLVRVLEEWGVLS